MNNYIHIINTEGERITSIVDNMLEPIGEKALLEQAKERYPNANQYIYGNDDTLNEFLNGKIYVDGQFIYVPAPAYEPTKEEKIAYIKKYYDSRFATLYKVLAHRQLINDDITDLQEQCKQLNLEMVAKIKEIQ